MKHNIKWLVAAIALSVWTGRSVGEENPSAGGPVPAERAGWKLHFRDHFKHEELGSNWQVLQGDWTVRDGALRGSGCLISTKGFPDDSWGFTRLECELELEAAPVPGGAGLGVMMHVRPPAKYDKPAWTSGYWFQWGAGPDMQSRIMRNDQEVTGGTPPGFELLPGRTYRLMVENDQGKVRWFIDDRLVLEFRDKSPFVAGNDYNRIGFYFGTAARVRNVRVYIKRMDDMDHFI